MATALLPPEFAALEPFAREWCLASEPERYAKRLASTMDELQAFYDALFPRAQDAIAYLEKFPLHELPEDALSVVGTGARTAWRPATGPEGRRRP